MLSYRYLNEHINQTNEGQLAFLKISGNLGSTRHELRTTRRPAVISNKIVHGSVINFPGYELVHVPPGAKVFPFKQESFQRSFEGLDLHENISSGTNTVKNLVALFQLFFAVLTLWRSRGNQIDTYGYAAFSLSVAPYAVMAVTNLLANALCLEYQTMFLVHNEILEEAESLYQVKVNGCVGELHAVSKIESSEPDSLPQSDPYIYLKFDGNGSRFTAQVQESCLGRQQVSEGVELSWEIISPAEALKKAILPRKVIYLPSHADYVQDGQEKWQTMAVEVGSM